MYKTIGGVSTRRDRGYVQDDSLTEQLNRTIKRTPTDGRRQIMTLEKIKKKLADKFKKERFTRMFNYTNYDRHIEEQEAIKNEELKQTIRDKK